MNGILQHAARILSANGLVTAFLFAGIVFFLSGFLADKLTRGRVHSSAIAIFIGLTAAYIGGVITGGEKGLADVSIFGGLGVLGGSMLRDFTLIASAYGAKIEVTGKKAEMLRERNIGSREIVLGVRPEHMTLADKNDPAAVSCSIRVNEMMGSELHLHVGVESGDNLIVRIPTVSLEDDQRAGMHNGNSIHITFEGKVMHFFDPETETNLLV
jgi:hypothetical protein